MGLKEQIYLLEIQVQDLQLDNVKELDCLEERDVKIYAHFLSFDPVLVYDQLDEEFNALPILFKMSPNELTKALDRSPLTLSVSGRLDETREYTIGTVKLLFTEAFPEAITLATSSVIYPVTAQLTEAFPFRNLYHEDTGSISVNLKLSCFGYIDIKRLGPCDLQDQYKESLEGNDKNAYIEDLEKDDNDLKPIITDLEHVQPASTQIGKFEGIKQSIPWQMANDQQYAKVESTPTQPVEKSRIIAEIRDANKNELTLQCTCEAIPDFMTQKPPPPQITLRCECADILAAMKSVFPAAQDVVIPPQPPESIIPQAPKPTQNPVTPQPVENTLQINATDTRSTVPAPTKPVVAPTSLPLTGMDVVPTSTVCGLELKSSNNKINPGMKVSSEEKLNPVQSNKPDNTNPVSNVEVVIPENKTEESSKKIKEDKEANWDERKQVIKKEYKMKSKKIKDVYEYTAGMYPGMVIGHKYCIPTVRLVPRNMGWMWNLLDLFGASKRNKGWRPGAIVKTVANNFGSWNRAAGFKDGDDVETYFNFKKKKGAKETEQFKESLTVKPTLHVHKKDKFYHITVNPPGQSNVKPLTFKVDPRKASSDEETSSESTSDDSFEFEYTVPAGLLPPPRKIEKANETTQYNVQDFSPKKKAEAPAPVEEQAKERKESKAKGGKGGKGGKGKKK